MLFRETNGNIVLGIVIDFGNQSRVHMGSTNFFKHFIFIEDSRFYLQ